MPSFCGTGGARPTNRRRAQNSLRIARHDQGVKTIDTSALAEATLAAAIGRTHRDDPVRPGTGGPAGNARLTAWTGVVLLALFVAELVTLLDVRGLIGWHVAVGVLLVPPALVKTG